MFSTISDQVSTLHENSIAHWKAHGIQLNETDFWELVEKNHSFNYQLWHAEDRARREDMGFEFVYHAKRDIDYYNQQRNNQMEAMDGWLFNQLQPTTNSSCPVHSETPGMMIDRLSILALKAYHMKLQTLRTDVDSAHIQQCTNKLKTIVKQRSQLQECLDQLLQEVANNTRTFRVYHQFKMYNDPTLNPELY